MADMHHQIDIESPPNKVYQALTTSEGLSGWWTGDSVATPEIGTVAEFGFSNRATLFRMRIEELVPDQRVSWLCLGDVDEWEGTNLCWTLSENEGRTTVRFTHAEWRSTDGWFAPCNTTWGALMHQLKNYAEDKNPGPFFKGHV